jgi:hypothetical protein
MAQKLNYDPNENIGAQRTAINVNWSATGNFDYENIGMFRLAFDADRLVPPRQGQLFPVNAPLFDL